ncbi:helix-turn-helix domain-containing protein [Streptomyces sp. NPDC057638]|uniref:helix-turn-helix domain-containing protein n=1 Tax=Streptomyces sp. NPDC057638 TaxID=3346190 RepID=UPI0036CCF58D
MGSMDVPGPGATVAGLRKEIGWGQARLASAAGLSTSYLGKIERGERALSQGVAAALARAMGIPLGRVLGAAAPPPDSAGSLRKLHSAVRRFDIPGEGAATEGDLRKRLAEMVRLRGDANLSDVLEKLPGLVSGVQDHAHAAGTPQAWSMVSQAYSAVYWLAARHRWMTLADLAVTKQKIAARAADPVTLAIAARDEAGVHLNHGEWGDGLAVVDRAIVRVEESTSGRERAYALGMLHLRGLTLAGRAKEKKAADSHIAKALELAEDFSEEVNRFGIHFGPENTMVHVIATSGDLNRHRRAIEVMEQLTQGGMTLPATRISPLHMNIARSNLAVGDREKALDHLERAWALAPQLSSVHPTSREVLRVLAIRHKRSNPRLMRLARMAKMNV